MPIRVNDEPIIEDVEKGEVCFACYNGFHEDCWFKTDVGVADCPCQDEWCLSNKVSIEEPDEFDRKRFQHWEEPKGSRLKRFWWFIRNLLSDVEIILARSSKR